MDFIKNFMSSDNSKVNSATVIVTLLAIPTILLGLAVVIYHSFILGRGLDKDVVALLLGIIGGGGVGFGIGQAAAKYGGRVKPPGE